MLDGLLGGGLGLLGSLFGGSMAASGARQQTRAMIQAGRENREYDQRALSGDMARQLLMMFGPERAEQILRATLPADQVKQLFRDPDAQSRRSAAEQEMADIDRQLAPFKGNPRPTEDRFVPGRGRQTTYQAGFNRTRAQQAGVNVDDLLRRRKELESSLKDGGPDNPDGIDLGAFREGGPGLMSEYDAMIGDARREGQEMLGQYGADTDTLMARMRAIQDEAAGYGAQERTRINRDTGRAITGTNRLIESKMLGRGLGSSSVMNNQISGNVRRLEEGRQDALGNLGDRQIALNTQLAGNSLGLLSDRLGGRTALMGANQDRVAGYRQNALGLQTQVLTGGAMQPGARLAGGNYMPGVSPGGTAQSVWGNALGAAGGMMLGRGGLNFDLSGLIRGGGNQPGAFDIDASYRPGSTLQGSNRPR